MDAGSIGLLRDAILADPFTFALHMTFALVSRVKEDTLTPTVPYPVSVFNNSCLRIY
jgi:hypothetical protein